MNHELTLLHRTGSERFDASILEALSAHFSFETCMRHVLLIPSEELELIAHRLRDSDEVYNGEAAYRFLLEVICGLHSPLVGETEVYGQLKNKVAEYQFSVAPWSAGLQRVFRSLFQDAKLIREKHLKDLGSQSYGSVLRREVKGAKRVHLLGAGHLVQEILPWLAKDGTEVHVHCREPEKARAVLPMKVQLHGIGETGAIGKDDVLVIAAPVTAAWIASWLGASHSGLRLLADLRSDSHVDRIGGDFGRTLELGEMLSRISANQSSLQQRKAAALAQALELSSERSRHTEYRPFGWEDVCA